MRILRVTPWLYPDTKGGGDYHVHAMSRDQAAMGHDVTVLTTREAATLPRVERTAGYTIRRVSPGVSLFGNDVSPSVARYLWRLDADSFDVVHAHSHLYFSTNLAALRRRLGAIPLAMTNHGLYSQSAPEWVFDVYLRTLGRWTFNQADLVFCYTDADKRRIQEFGVESHIQVVSNGIDTERFTPNGNKNELIDSEVPVVLFVGRLVEGKRPMDALAAIEKLEMDVSLYVCGDGPLRRELEEQAGDRCTFLGQVSYEEMPAVYRAADLLVQPSRAEGTPRTVMEALSSGVPVVSSDLSHIRAAFGESVMYFECGNVTDLRSKIAAQLAEEHTGQLGDEFSWTQTVRETTAALQSIATPGGDE